MLLLFRAGRTEGLGGRAARRLMVEEGYGMVWEISETRFMVSMLILLFIVAIVFIAYYTARAFRWRLVDRWSALTTLGISVTLIFFLGSPFKNGYILVPPVIN